MGNEFKERAAKFRAERSKAWDDFIEISSAAGYTIEDNLANRSLFMGGYESGKEAAYQPASSEAIQILRDWTDKWEIGKTEYMWQGGSDEDMDKIHTAIRSILATKAAESADTTRDALVKARDFLREIGRCDDADVPSNIWWIAEARELLPLPAIEAAIAEEGKESGDKH